MKPIMVGLNQLLDALIRILRFFWGSTKRKIASGILVLGGGALMPDLRIYVFNLGLELLDKERIPEGQDPTTTGAYIFAGFCVLVAALLAISDGSLSRRNAGKVTIGARKDTFEGLIRLLSSLNKQSICDLSAMSAAERTTIVDMPERNSMYVIDIIKQLGVFAPTGAIRPYRVDFENNCFTVTPK